MEKIFLLSFSFGHRKSKSKNLCFSQNMATSNLLFPLTITPLTISNEPMNSTFLFSQKQPTFLTLTKFGHKSRKPIRPRRVITTQSKGGDSADAPDRLISAVCYFYPFFDGIQYGKYVITQFSPIQTLIQPLLPAIKVFKGFIF